MELRLFSMEITILVLSKKGQEKWQNIQRKNSDSGKRYP